MAKTIKVDKRTPREIAQAVAATVDAIAKVEAAVSIMTGNSFFNYTRYKKTGFDKMVTKLCAKRNVNETHIRTVGGWTKKEEDK